MPIAIEVTADMIRLNAELSAIKVATYRVHKIQIGRGTEIRPSRVKWVYRHVS